MKRRIVVGMGIVFFGFLSAASAQQNEEYAPNRLLGQFSENTAFQINDNGCIEIEGQEIGVLLQEFDVEKIVPLSRRSTEVASGATTYSQPFVMHFKEAIPVKELANALMETGLFKFVEPDFITKASGICEVVPNDTHYKSKQWSLNNTGEFDAKSVENADIDMNHAWTITQGSKDVIVAILDSGNKPGHPEFSGRTWENSAELAHNGIDEDKNGYVDDTRGWDFVNDDSGPVDDNGHGVHVSGVLGATGNNGTGCAGVDWNCKLMNCKVLAADAYGYYSWMASAIYYAVDNGADVINMSIGGSDFSTTMEVAVAYAYKNNVPIVASMGNENTSKVSYPAGHTQTIAVGATDTDNSRVSPFSWGGGSNYGKHIDICAPGSYMYGLTTNDKIYVYRGGTSLSAPLVTGVIALIKALKPNMPIDSIEMLLQQGATDQVGRSSEDSPGWDMYHGYGVLNAYKTLLLASAKNVSACDAYVMGGRYFDSSVVQYDTLTGSGNCSSVVVTNIIIGYSPQRTYQKSACDSFQWIDGKVYRTSINEVTYLSNNPFGCDSIHLLNLEVQKGSSATQRVSACQPYTWIDGTTYNRSDSSMTYVLPNSVGCDSTIRLYLDITTIRKELIEYDHSLRAITTDVHYQWLDCDAAMAPIAGENGETFHPTKSGNFAVAMEKADCRDTSNCYRVIPAGLSGADPTGFKIYPNPCTNQFRIVPPAGVSVISVTLMNHLGQTIVQKSHQQSSEMVYALGGIPPGVYYVQLGLENGAVMSYILVKQ